MAFPDNSVNEINGYLAAIVESSDDAIIGKTLDGVITAWNAAAERLFGYTRNEAIGQPITILIPEDRQDEEFVIIGKVRNGERLEHFETVRKTKDGRLIDISLTVSPIRNDRGEIVGISKIAHDISAAKQAERTAASLAAIVDASDDIIVSKTLEGIITAWNPAAERTFGYSAQEAIGQHIGLIIPPEKMDEEYAILGKIKAGIKVDHFETRRRAKSGEIVDVLLTVSPVRDRSGRVIGASKVARDITEQKRIETELRDSNRRKDEFLANMSHELRTPMNAVIGLAHILSMSQNLNPKEQQCVAMLRQSSDNLLSLINNLLDFSRLETDSLQLEQVEFSPAEVLEKVIVLLDVKAREKNLALKVGYGRELKDRYAGDPLRLQQVLTNIVGNAVKFTEKGQIEVSLRVKAERLADSVLVFEISDTGIGIPEDKLPVIFEKFIQADASTTRKYGGSGLGLAICQQIVEAMGGTISVVSKPDVGSTFTVEIPFRNAPHQSLLTPKRETFGPERRNVLVVEDYEANALVVTTMLEHLGYSYDVAHNGMEALRKAERGLFDLILMDVQMPGMDGFESTRLIRAFEKDNRRQRTPIVAMTAHVQSRDKEQCIKAGMNDFIPKPFEPSVLQQVLERYVPDEAANVAAS